MLIALQDQQRHLTSTRMSGVCGRFFSGCKPHSTQTKPEARGSAALSIERYDGSEVVTRAGGWINLTAGVNFFPAYSAVSYAVERSCLPYFFPTGFWGVTCHWKEWQRAFVDQLMKSSGLLCILIMRYCLAAHWMKHPRYAESGVGRRTIQVEYLKDQEKRWRGVPGDS